jgi:hypothetical protein
MDIEMGPTGRDDCTCFVYLGPQISMRRDSDPARFYRTPFSSWKNTALDVVLRRRLEILRDNSTVCYCCARVPLDLKALIKHYPEVPIRTQLNHVPYIHLSLTLHVISLLSRRWSDNRSARIKGIGCRLGSRIRDIR